jgi:hypothetical protein
MIIKTILKSLLPQQQKIAEGVLMCRQGYKKKFMRGNTN